MTEYGLQLYSIRDCMKENMDEAIRQVAELGYQTVEPAGFFGRTSEEVKAMLEKNGLKLSGTHSGWTELRDDYEGTLKYHKTLGNRRYVIPGADLTTAEKLTEFVDFVNEVQPKLEKEGITLHYHNHSSEFLPNQDGLVPHEELQKRTKLWFEIDTYWAYRAELDPLALMDKLRDRISVVHVKDGTMERGLSLGLGTAPVREVVAVCKERGIDMVVESEEQEPDGISEVKRCIEFLKTLE